MDKKVVTANAISPCDTITVQAHINRLVTDMFGSTHYECDVYISASTDEMVVATIAVRVHPGIPENHPSTMRLHHLHTKVAADLSATFATVSITFVR